MEVEYKGEETVRLGQIIRWTRFRSQRILHTFLQCFPCPKEVNWAWEGIYKAISLNQGIKYGCLMKESTSENEEKGWDMRNAKEVNQQN